MTTIDPTSGANAAGIGNTTPITGAVTEATSGADLTPQAPQPSAKIRVLLVDDEPLIRKLIVASAKSLRPF